MSTEMLQKMGVTSKRAGQVALSSSAWFSCRFHGLLGGVGGSANPSPPNKRGDSCSAILASSTARLAALSAGVGRAIASLARSESVMLASLSSSKVSHSLPNVVDE